MLPRPLSTLTCLATAAALLNGCAPASSERPVNGCAMLSLAPYSQAVQNEVANEMEAAAVTARWPELLTDYAALRAQVRACRGVEE